KDRHITEWLEPKAGIKAKTLSDLIFNSGSVILSAPPAEVIRTDFKIYNENQYRFSVSQVEELGFRNFWKQSDALELALEELTHAEALDFAALLVTDINTHNSLLVIRGNKSFIEMISY